MREGTGGDALLVPALVVGRENVRRDAAREAREDAGNGGRSGSGFGDSAGRSCATLDLRRAAHCPRRRRLGQPGVGTRCRAPGLPGSRAAARLGAVVGRLRRIRSLGDHTDPDFDPVRAGELLASPVHYAFERPESGLRALVWDLANLEDLAGPGDPTDDDLRRILGPHRDVLLPARILWEGLAAPNWGGTVVVAGERGRAFHGLYVGAGPYLSASVDTHIDPDLPETLASSATVDMGNRLPANVESYNAVAATVQAATAVTGGYRARFALPTAHASERDGIYVAANYHYLFGLGLGRIDGALDIATDEVGRLVDGASAIPVAFYEAVGSRSGRGFAVDAGVEFVVGRIDIGVGARGLGIG